MSRQMVHECRKYFKVNLKQCEKGYTSVGKFSPLPKLDVLFEFKAWYEIIHPPRDENSSLSVFRLKLEKLYGFNIKQSLECDVEISVEYGNSPMQNFNNPNPSPCFLWDTAEKINVETMNTIHFENATHKMYKGSDKSFHHKRIEIDSPVLRSSIKFYVTVSLSDICMQDTSNPRTFINDFQIFFNSSILSDVVFKIGGQCIQAHKVILAAHSPVFRTMLTQDFLESKTNCIEITDCAYAVFEHFIKFLYVKKIEDSSYSTVTELLALSDKYDVPSLKEECARKLMSSVTVDTICDILVAAYNFNNEKLKIFAVAFASAHFKTLKSKEEWKSLVVSHPIIGYEVVKRYSARV